MFSIEVAGVQHNSTQRLYLGVDKDSEQGLELKAAATHFKDGERYRSLVEFHNIQNVPRELGIRIAMHGRGEPPLYLPLILQLQPVPKDTEKTPWDTIIIPVKPLTYLNDKKSRPESDILQEGGWVYVFWKNKLWRELEVSKNQTYRYTRLAFYRNARQSRLGLTDPNTREALGTAYDTIWIPYKLNGEVQQGATGIKMLFSKQQLSWDAIDELESNPGELDKQTTSVDSIKVYEQTKGFDLADGPVGPIAPALLDQNKEVVPPQQNKRVSSERYLDANREHKIPVVYLNERPIDTKVTAIYPVRFAYANFFEESLESAVEPPPINTMLGANTIADGKGYVIRLLRQGWVYIREEDDSANGHFHIFKYTKTEENGEVKEQFDKYLFKNKVNAQGGLVYDSSGSENGYPFIFVKRTLKEISIAYSEHEWHADVIDKMNGQLDARKKAMQRVNLHADQDPYALPATAENFKQLVEDYRSRKNRLLALKNADVDPSVKDISLDVLTTETSYELEAEQIAAELQKKTLYSKTARIVALHDPVGRQKEIARVHGMLSLWEKEYASRNMYPYVIGQIVNDLKRSAEGEVKEIVEESINWQEHGEYWQNIEDEFSVFKERQEQFATLYKSFMFGSPNVGNVGSLDTYFKYFFCHAPHSDQDAEHELQKLCKLSAGIYQGIMASVPGKQALEEIISDAAEQPEEIENAKNGYYLSFQIFRFIVTTPQKGYDWSITTVKLLDWVLQHLGSIWGHAVSLLKFSKELGQRTVNRLTFNALKYVTNQLIYDVLRVYGLELDINKSIRMTHDELAKTLAHYINKSSSGKNANTILDKAVKKVQRGQSLFNWAERVKTQKLPELLNLSEVRVMKASGNRYSFVTPKNKVERIGLLFDTGFAGLSATFNMMTIYDIAQSTHFSNANPLNERNGLYSAISVIASINSLMLDTTLILRSGTLATSSILNKAAPSLAKALAPKMMEKATILGNFLSNSAYAATYMAIANYGTMVLSAWDALRAYNRGNYGESTGYSFIAVGSALIFAHALYAAGIASTTAGSAASATGVGSPPGVMAVAAGLLFMGVGGALIYIYGQTPLETLLKNCFWGSGPKYIFWPKDNSKLLRDDRPNINQRLSRTQQIASAKEIQLAYRMELQEFMNILYMPQLELDKDIGLFPGSGNTYHYKFILPGFEPGISEVEFALYTKTSFQEDGQITIKPDKLLTQQMTEKMKTADVKLKEGAAHFTLEMKFNTKVSMFWVYRPQPNIIVPMRLITDDGRLKTPIIGMRDESSL
ncbi:toxin VasX [Zooshikella sp. RANM57]|uniref:toxin VasX n=1 Tax=Zooshikella sp. RANM57 TaxID=3425863 RepID=UPI003D6DBBA7